tara:strand:- start:379 stop:1014 length:636 start_codon:yes stop_codon:yes gene_type:complete
MPPYKTNILPLDQTLLTLNDLGIKTASATEFEVENNSTSLVLNSTNTTITANDLEIDEIDAENEFDVDNIQGVDLAIGIGVLKYNPSIFLIQYSTTAASSGVTFSLTLTHSGYSGINGIYMKEDNSTGTDLISPNPTSFSPRLENASRSIGTITSSSTTIAIAANANSGSSSYAWSGPSTISSSGFSSFYRIFTGFANGSYTLVVTSVDDD